MREVWESERPIAHVAPDLGINSEVLRKYMRQAEADRGERPKLLSTSEREELRRLRRENAELRLANLILKDPACISRASSTRPGEGDRLHRN